MARTRTIKIATLNIAMHQPHSPERYLAMMKEAYALRHVVRLGALHAAMLGALYLPRAGDKEGWLEGELYRFVRLDPDEPWFNMATNEEASAEELGQIRIPQHLSPHMGRFPFVFDPARHELWFIAKDRKDSLGPGAAVSIFQSIFKALSAAADFPEIEVTAIPDAEQVERLLTLPTLNKMVIELSRPNADDGDDDEVRFLRRLERQNAKKMRTELVAESHQSIAPDEETRRMAMVAANNGKVSVIGRDAAGMHIDESTSEHPRMDTVIVDPNIETEMDVLRRIAGRGG